MPCRSFFAKGGLFRCNVRLQLGKGLFPNAGDIHQLLHVIKTVVLLPVVNDTLGDNRPHTGQLIQLLQAGLSEAVEPSSWMGAVSREGRLASAGAAVGWTTT